MSGGWPGPGCCCCCMPPGPAIPFPCMGSPPGPCSGAAGRGPMPGGAIPGGMFWLPWGILAPRLAMAPPPAEDIAMWPGGPAPALCLLLGILPWLGGPPAPAGWPGWGILELGGMLEYCGPGPDPGMP